MGRPNAAEGDQKQALPMSRSKHLLASCVTRSYINAVYLGRGSCGGIFEAGLNFSLFLSLSLSVETDKEKFAEIQANNLVQAAFLTWPLSCA
jgi:hypothetical protein